MYLDSLEPYIDELDKKLHRQKRISERNAKGQSFEKQIDTAQSLYAISFRKAYHNQKGILVWAMNKNEYSSKVS